MGLVASTEHACQMTGMREVTHEMPYLARGNLQKPLAESSLRREGEETKEEEERGVCVRARNIKKREWG